MKTAARLIACAVLLGGCATQRAATYNIRNGHGLDYSFAPDRTAQAILRLKAETVVLNEVDRGADRSGNIDLAAILGEKTGMRHFFGAACELPGGEYGNAVLSIHPIEPVEVIAIPDNGTESRSASLVRIAAPAPYYVVAVHLPYEEELEAERVAAINLIHAKVLEHRAIPVILMGDLNATADSPVVGRLRELGFTVAADQRPKMSSYPADRPEMLIDFIAFYPASAFEVTGYEVADEPEASDHRPARADFRLTGKRN